MVHRLSTRGAALLALLAIGACERQPRDAQQASPNAPAAETKAPAPPATEPSMNREQIIIAAMRALSAAALGENDAPAQKALRGKEFELKLRFGCPGMSANAARSWRFDAKEQVLRVHISADLAAEGVPASDLLLRGYEGIAGFTIGQPLLLSAGCPASRFTAISAGGPTVAIAQLFTSEDSRVQRPQHSYELTRKAGQAHLPTAGLDLVIAGRLAELADGRVIRCGARDGAPACIIAAKFDRLTIENPATGAVLGEWSQW